MKAVTIYPAQIFGVDKLLGNVEVGKMANLIVTDGDQLEFKNSVKHMFINGKPADPSSRRPQLWDMFVQECEILVSIASGSERRFLSLPTDRDSLATARGTDQECKMRNAEELFFHIPHFLFTALA